EPWITAILGHERGIFAPGVRNRRIAYQAAHHLLLSHALALQAIRDTGCKAQLGIVLNMSPVSAATDSEIDAFHARREDGRLIRWFMDPLFKGTYPSDMLEYLGRDAPEVEPGDMQLIARPFDFLGINYYHPTNSSSANPTAPASDGASVTDMGWEVAPRSLTQLLLRLRRDYAIPALLITENGAAYRDQIIDGHIDDEDRRHYIESHLAACADAIGHGVPLKGYFVWSLLDNFEWAEGYRKRFGIVHVDYATQQRTLKRSACWYRDFLAAGR
ncbi:MAG TPA: family 1 glycosylhydrolase, partial [Povalibacter sp.]